MKDNKLIADRFNRLGAKITYYRRIRQIRQIDLAYNVGISEQYLSRVERGRQPTGLTLLILFRLSDELGVSIEDFFKDHNRR